MISNTNWNAIWDEGYDVGWNDRYHQSHPVRHAPSNVDLGISKRDWDAVWNAGFDAAYGKQIHAPAPGDIPSTHDTSGNGGPIAAPATAGPHAGSAAQQQLWSDQCRAAAAYVHIPDYIEWGVYGMETNFGRYIALSSADAIGLMQFLPSTAAQWNYPQTNYPDASESQAQFTAAALYLRHLYHQRGDWDSALRAYSGGGYGLAAVTAKANSFPQPVDTGTTGVSSGGGAYVNPMREANVTPERIDQGVDYAGSGYLCAIADSYFSFYKPGLWAPYGNYIEYVIQQSGPLYAVHIYYAEGIRALVPNGATVRAGQRIAQIIDGWRYGIECGFAAGDGSHSWAHTFGGGYIEGYSTRAGIAYDTLVRSLGGPGGHQQGGVMGSWPPFMRGGRVPSGVTGGAPAEVAPPGGDPHAIELAFQSLDYAGDDINLWKYLSAGADIVQGTATDYRQRLGQWAYLNPYGR